MFDFGMFAGQFEAAFGELLKELSRLKGFNFGTVSKAITQIVTQGPILIPLWGMASPEERKRAIVDAVNKKIDVPWVPETVEGWAFGFIYDAVYRRLF